MHYLETGVTDALALAWPGDSIIARGRSSNEALRNALIEEVISRTPSAQISEQVVPRDIAAFAGDKIARMVCGLFPVNERAALMDMFSRSVVFLSPDNIASELLKARFLSTAWSLANLYLLSCGAEALSKQAPALVGLSEGTKCYVSLDYFRYENRLDDFVVHEAAHVFHNCKRETIGLPRIRGRDWLLEIEFQQRELFAYACEAYSCIVALGSTRASRRILLAELKSGPPLADDRIDPGEYLALVGEAVESSNGWKKIHDRCRPRSRSGRLSISST